MANVFAVPVFFIVFRETVETSLVVSILLAFLKQQMGPEHDVKTYKKLRNQVRTHLSLWTPLAELVRFIGLVGYWHWPGNMSHHRRWSDWGLLWIGKRRMGRGRIHLGRRLRYRCQLDHLCHGGSATSCLQAPGQMAGETGESTGGQRQQD